jgi:hypothetical protein
MTNPQEAAGTAATTTCVCRASVHGDSGCGATISGPTDEPGVNADPPSVSADVIERSVLQGRAHFKRRQSDIGLDQALVGAFKDGMAAAHVARQLGIPDDWRPTPENVNRLPAPLFRYVARIETNADPGGMVRDNIRLRDENAALALALAEATKPAPAAAVERGSLEEIVRRALADFQFEPWEGQAFCPVCNLAHDPEAPAGRDKLHEDDCIIEILTRAVAATPAKQLAPQRFLAILDAHLAAHLANREFAEHAAVQSIRDDIARVVNAAPPKGK